MILQLQRKPFPGSHSVEGLFATLRTAQNDMGMPVECRVAPHLSKGYMNRLRNICWASSLRADVLHITGDIHYIALGLPCDKTILTIHDCEILERTSGLRRWLLKLLWYELPIRRAAVVTVISEETKLQLIRHVCVPAERIVVIPDAVGPVFRPCPKAFNAECPRILQIGTKPNKNLPRLIEALRGLNCRLMIVGKFDNSLRKQLELSAIGYETAENLSNVEMYRAYCDADIVSFVSTYEGFGMPIIEAQWVERPVITSNCSSMPEVAGEGACFVNPFDVNSIRRGFEQVIGDAEYRGYIVAQGRKNRERFALAEVAKRYTELYQRLRRDHELARAAVAPPRQSIY